MTHDEINELAAARWLSATLAACDLIEATYRGPDEALAHFAGTRLMWLVVGEVDAVALLSPYPLPLDLPKSGKLPAIPLTEFEGIQRVGNALDDE